MAEGALGNGVLGNGAWRRGARASGVALLAVAGCLIPGAAASAAIPTTCGTHSGGSTGFRSHVSDVRVGRHIGFDRFVVQFSTSRVPRFTLVPKSGTLFHLDPSDRPVRLLGTAGLRVTLRDTTGQGTYHGSTDLRPRFPQLREARLIGDFEGITTWGLGLAHQSCKRILTLRAPARLVIDVPH